MFRSTDNGDTWTEQNSGFTALDVNSLALNSAGNIFAAALGGAFRSTNSGESWSDISSGLIPAGGNVWSVAIDADGYALAGTAGGGEDLPQCAINDRKPLSTVAAILDG